jgi:hypothetical protein
MMSSPIASARFCVNWRLETGTVRFRQPYAKQQSPVTVRRLTKQAGTSSSAAAGRKNDPGIAWA